MADQEAQSDDQFYPKKDQQNDDFVLASQEKYRFMITANRTENRIDGSCVKKMIVCAVVFALVGGTVTVRVMLAGNGVIQPRLVAIVLLSSALVGASLGAVLALKDRIEFKLKDRQQVAFPLRMLFGLGAGPLFAIWFSVIFITVLIVLQTTLVMMF